MTESYGLTYDDVSSKLRYEPDTGLLFWLISPARNIPAGAEAGCVKATRVSAKGVSVSYKYIRIDGRSITAAQIAWLLINHEWPVGRIGYRDGDPLNLREENLIMANALPVSPTRWTQEDKNEYVKRFRSSFPMEWKDGELRSKYGINLAEYTAMAIAQNGKCAICEKEETEERSGKLRALAVDHNHSTGAVRGLLCQSCNKMIGLACDDVTVLAKAISYLDKHSGSNVVPFVKEPA